jgi:hypothetical protein
MRDRRAGGGGSGVLFGFLAGGKSLTKNTRLIEVARKLALDMQLRLV